MRILFRTLMSSLPASQLPKPPPLGCTLPALPMTTFSRLIENVQNGRQPIEIAYKTNTNWPFPGPTRDKAVQRKSLAIHILDSSFNPPTKAHLALARTHQATHNADQANIHANILLLSVSNADKKIAASDATYLQRVEMMVLLADTLATSQPDFGGVAIALVNEPLFAQKQNILNQFLPSIIGGDSGTNLDLIWQVGVDTLKRLFDTKYYDGDKEKMMRVLGEFLQEPLANTSGGKLLCARRQMGDGDADPVEIPGTESFIQSGRIEMVEIGRWESSLSSTSIRKGVRENNDTKPS